MTQKILSQKVGALADYLRDNGEESIGLSDMAAASEILIKMTESFFRSIDTTILEEFQALSGFIEDARKEVAELQPGELKTERIPRAGLELDAIVQSTEEATNTIMEAAEEIMSIEAADAAAYGEAAGAACMRIFEACSFQDITGQRISKVVSTLKHIEAHIEKMRDVWGVTKDHESASAGTEPETLLNGPALDGEGIDQDQVDDLIGGAPSDSVSPKAAEPAPAVAPAPDVPASDAPASDAPASDASDEGEEASQDDIDALFD